MMISGNLANKSLIILLFISLAFNVYQQKLVLAGLYVYEYIDDDDASNDGILTTETYSNQWKDGEEEAQTIIQRSYLKSYAHIIPCDVPLEDGSNRIGKACMKQTLDYFNPPPPSPIENNGVDTSNNTSTIPSIPWWFQTLLRDTQTNGAYGFWHHFTTTDPPINFCTIGKVATTEWRKIFCQLNKDDCMPNPVEQCGKKKCTWQTKQDMPNDAPWAVFVRDPLERLLSGFIDKCVRPRTRKLEKHCEPNVIFNPDSSTLVDAKNNTYPSLVQNLDDKDKQFFAAYVDVLPLKVSVCFL